jgi:hypothetical protein
MRGLARTWRETRNNQIPKKIGDLLSVSTKEAEKLLKRFFSTDTD